MPVARKRSAKNKISKKAQHHLPAGRVQSARHPLVSLGILAGGAAVFMTAFWLVSASGLVANRFKPQLELELSKALNREVTVSRMEGGLFDRVVIRDVCISTRKADPSSLDVKIQRIIVQYSLWDILVRKYSLADSIYQIQLIHPVLEFERLADGTWRTPRLMIQGQKNPPAGPAIPAPKIPHFKISLISGEIRMHSGTQTATLRNLKGLLNLKDPSAARLYLSGCTDKRRWPNFKISGNLDLTSGSVRLGMNASRMELNTVMQVVHVSDYFEVENGQADLELQIASHPQTPQDIIPGIGVSGKMVLYDLTMRSRVIKTPLKNIFGVVQLQDRNLTVKNLQAIFGKTAWKAQGEIKNIQTPDFNIRVRSDAIELSDWIELLPNLNGLYSTGRGKAAILIRGQAPDLTVTANFSMPDGKIGHLGLHQFDVIARYHARELRLLLARGALAQGWLEGQGKILFPENEKEPAMVDFRGDARELELKEIAEMLGLKKVAGQMSGQILITGTLNDPAMAGELHSNKITFLNNAIKNIHGRMAYGHRAVKADLNLDWGPLQNTFFHLEAKQSDPKSWRLETLSIAQKKQEFLNVSGTWGGSMTAPVHLLVTTRDFPIQNIPLLPSELNYLNGYINFKLNISGNLQAPVLSGVFNTRKLLVLNDGPVDSRGELGLDSRGVQFRNVSIDRNRLLLNGEIEFGSIPALKGKLALAHMPMQHLLGLGGVKSAQPLLGNASGTIDCSGKTEQLKLDGNVRMERLSWKDIHAENGTLNFSTNGKRIWIKELSLKQSQGDFNLVLETELGKDSGPFQILAKMKEFDLGHRLWSGNLKLKGDFMDAAKTPKYQALLDLDKLEVEHKKMPAASGELELVGSKVFLRKFNWGKELAAAGEMEFSPPYQGMLQVSLNHSNLHALRTLLFKDRGGLEEYLTGSVSANLQAKNLRTEIKLAAGTGLMQGEVNVLLDSPKTERYAADVQFRKMKLSTLFDLGMLANPKDSPSGLVDGKIHINGGEDQKNQQNGELAFTDFLYGRWTFKTLKVAWEKNNDAILLKTFEGRQPLGSLNAESGSLHFRPDGTMAVNLNLQADNFAFFSRNFYGKFVLDGSLALNPFDLQLSMASPDFKLNLYPFGDFRLLLHYHGENLDIRTPTNYPYPIACDLILPPNGDVVFNRLTISDPKQVYIDTHGRVDGSGTTDLLINVKNVPADVIARSLGWTQPWTGLASGSFRYTDPGRITHFDIHVKIDNGSVFHIPFDTFYGHVVLDRDWLHFLGPEGNSVLSRYGKYTMQLSGKLPLPQSDQAAEKLKGAEMDLRVRMPEGDLSYLTFVPYIAGASGKSSLDLQIKGTMDYPALNGRATIENGILLPRLYAPRIEHFNADLAFDNNQVTAKVLEGTIGKGQLKITPGKAGKWLTIFRRLEPDQLNMKLISAGNVIRLDTTQDYEFISAGVKADATLSGSMENPILGGTMEFSDGQFTFPPRLLSDFAKGIKPSNMAYDQLKLVSQRNLWYYNDVVRAQIKPNQAIVLDGDKYTFRADGTLFFDKGTFTYLETDFTLDPSEETELICHGRGKPQLQCLASTTIHNVSIKDEGRSRDATIYLRVQGEMGALKIKLDSDPVMTQAQIMSLLTLGEDYSNWSQDQLDQKVQSAGAKVLGRVAGNLIGREIEKSLKKITPIDVVDIRLGGVEKLADNIMTGTGNSANASAASSSTGSSLLQNTQIDVGKYVTDSLYLDYRGILKERSDEKGNLAWQSYVGMEYNLDSSRKIKVYKNFDVDSNQEMFWGIENRVQFEGWKPEEDKKDAATKNPSLFPTPTLTSK